MAMRLLLDGVVSKVIINDKCPLIATFWRVLFNDTENLLRLISETPVNIETWETTRQITQHHNDYTPVEVAHALFFQNRTNFSGVIKGGIIGGKKQMGKYKLGARYPKERLLKLISCLAEHRDSVQIHNDDALSFIMDTIVPMGEKCFTYCDPPYYIKGKELYLNAYSHEDHAAMASLLISLPRRTKWIASYDNVEAIIKLYQKRRIYSFDLPYSTNIVRRGQELLILSPAIQTRKIPDSLLKLTPIRS